MIHGPNLPHKDDKADKDIGLCLSELEFLMIHEAFQLCPRNKLLRLQIGSATYIIDDRMLNLLSTKIDYVYRKIKAGG